MARVSRAADDSRDETPSMAKRSTKGAMSGWVWRRQPPATKARTKPRLCVVYSSAKARHAAVTRSTGVSRSSASSCAGTGSTAERRTASMARCSSDTPTTGPSAVIFLDDAGHGTGHGGRAALGRGPGDPGHDEVAEGDALVEGHPAPLAQLEQGQEADDHLHARGAVAGEVPEADRALVGEA